MVKFGYTIFYVNDVQKSIEFFENSFGFQRKFITPDFDYGELITGETTISFASISLAKGFLKDGFLLSDINKKPFGIEIGLVTDDVQGYLDKAIKNGAQLVEKPIEKPWGQTVCYVKDPNGFLIEICTPIADE